MCVCVCVNALCDAQHPTSSWQASRNANWVNTQELWTVPFSIGMESDAVNWTKMTLDAPKLFLKDHVVKPSIKFANSGRSCCDVHGFLTSTKHHLQNRHTTLYLCWTTSRGECTILTISRLMLCDNQWQGLFFLFCYNFYYYYTTFNFLVYPVNFSGVRPAAEKWTYGNCCSWIIYRLDWFPVIQPTALVLWKLITVILLLNKMSIAI